MSHEADDGTAATRREGPTPARTSRDEQLLVRGTLVGRYVVLDVLGKGGMGVVYAAYDPELDRKVAVKLMQAKRGASTASGTGSQAWLLREAQAMARLQHPNVLSVHDVGTLGDRVFVAMELVQGTTLREWLRDAHAWREVVAVMRAAGAGLAAAHAAGLVHRDFKPENVLVGDDGRVRVMDFGLARLDDEAPDADAAAHDLGLKIESKSPLSDRLSETGAVLGTPAYIAPEIYAGRAADARADQFSFGVALYEALYGERPFLRDDLVANRATVPKPPSSSRVPLRIERTVLRAIALDSPSRFASMNDLLHELAVDPVAVRRRAMIGGAIVATCAVVAFGAYTLRGDTGNSELCTGSPAKLAGVWDVPAHTALESAFRKTGKPFAEDAVRGTEMVLDAYAARWAAMHKEACEATRVRGEQSDEVLDLRMECLDNRLVELKTLTGVFASADVKLVSNAVTTAHKLSPLSDCADIAGLRTPDPLPKDPVARAQVSAIRAKLAEGQALEKASRFTEALALADRIADQTKRLAHFPTEAELHLLRGQTKWFLQRGSNGEAELLEAVWAAEAGKADATKIDAWLALVKSATEASRFDVALERWRHASAAVARLGDKWRTRQQLLGALAWLHARKGAMDAALAAAREARELRERHKQDADARDDDDTRFTEATILAMMGRTQEALDAFGAVLSEREARNGPKHDTVAEALHDIAVTEIMANRAQDAVAHARRALAIKESISGPVSADVALTLIALGNALSIQNDLDGALAAQTRAAKIIGTTLGERDRQYATALNAIANTLIAMKRPQDALPYIDRAVAVSTAKLGPQHYDVSAMIRTQCDALRAAGQIARALDTCRRALAICEKAMGRDSPHVFGFLASVGETSLAAKKPREASVALERALKVGSDVPEDVHQVELFAARAAWDLGNRARAVELARKARDGFAQLGARFGDQLREANTWLAQHAR